MNDHAAHVLLIEDNQGDADLVRLRMVEANSDLQVACVDRLSAGLASMSQEPPALVLLDLNLPDSKGAETFRSVLQQAGDVPVVVLSGRDDEQLAIRAVHQGAQDFLVKGAFDSKQLARAMRYAMERQALLTSLDISRKQQLQFKDQFLSHVSHELRTPLTSIHQFVTILLDDLAGPLLPEQREHLETTLRSVNQLRAMIGDLLEATRAESGKLQVNPRCIAIGGLIEQAVAMLRATAQDKQISLEASADARAPLALADPERILQVLLNLLDNALKFTPVDGSVQVRAHVNENEPDLVCVSVSDTGQGISPESKALIFERLYQDEAANATSRKGMGLGLYIVREIVRLHGGQIWVESQAGHGSTFSFTLPLFSMARILASVITEQGRLRPSLSLVRAELIAKGARGVGDSDEASNRCRELLQDCIVPTKDMLLPDMGAATGHKQFLIVASTDAAGAGVLCKRIRERFDSSELKANAKFKVSAEAIALPASVDEAALTQSVQEVADRVAEMAGVAIGQGLREQADIKQAE